MKSLLVWIISIVYFGVILYFYKNYDFLKIFHNKVLLIVKNQSLANVLFTTSVIFIPEGFFLYLVNHKWKKWREILFYIL